MSTSTSPPETERLIEAAEAALRALEAATGFSIRVCDESGAVLRAADGPALASLRWEEGHTALIEVVDAGGGGNRAGQAAQAAADTLSRIAAREREVTGLADELLAMYEEVSLLYTLGSELGASLDPRELADVALRRALQATGARRGHVAVDAGEGVEGLEVLTGRGSFAAGTLLPPETSLASRVAESGRSSLLGAGETCSAPKLAGEREGDEPVLLVPLHADGDGADERAGGVLALAGSADGGDFTAGDRKFATAIATQLAVALRTSRMAESLREAERVARDLEVAANIQQLLLPASPPTVAGADVAGRCVPAANVGGDYYDHLVGRDGALYLLVADVAGHSIGSALLMATARGVVRRAMDDGRPPAEILATLNETLYPDLERAELFITAFCARWEPDSDELRWANGGHNLPLRVCADGTVETLDADGMPAGILPDVPFEERRGRLAPGDTLVLYTDGVVEARSPAEEMLGDERLTDLVRESRKRPAADVVGRVLEAVETWTEGAPSSDDVTVVALRRTGADGSR